MLTFLLTTAFGSGCDDFNPAPIYSTCGYQGTAVRLGDWNTVPCKDQCEAYLRGRSGCCYRKENQAHCWVMLGDRRDQVFPHERPIPPGGVFQNPGAVVKAVSCNAPTYTGDQWLLAPAGSMNCPTGYEPITDETDCLVANDKLAAGRFFYGVSTSAWTGRRPHGCFLQRSTGRNEGAVYFNPFPGGYGRGETLDVRLCKKTPITDEFPLGGLGTNDCPSGFVPILDKTKCEQAAATHPDLAPFLDVTGSTWAGTRPHGCFLHTPNSRVHFNVYPGGFPPRAGETGHGFGGRINAPNTDRRLCEAAPANDGAGDTPGWINGPPEAEATPGLPESWLAGRYTAGLYTCHDYKYLGWCKNGAPVTGLPGLAADNANWLLGEPYNFPENNCVVCGK